MVIAVVVAYWPRCRPVEAFGWPNATARTNHPGGHRRHHRVDPLRWSHHPAGQTMTVRVYFHQQAPGPESDPGKVVPVSRTVPRSPSVATPPSTSCWVGRPPVSGAAGYWSFFSDKHSRDIAPCARHRRHRLADFRDFRRLVPNATNSCGSAALLAELDATLRQFLRPSSAPCTPSTATCRRSTHGFSSDRRGCRGHLACDHPCPLAGRDSAAASGRPPAAGLGRAWPHPRCGPPPAA